MVKKKIGWKKIVAAGVITTSLGLGFWASKTFYEVKDVIDGDTFVTKELQFIRLEDIDAPELDGCLGKEAKDELTKLIAGKKVFIKVIYTDARYNRLVGSVYTWQGNVEEVMLRKGLATFRGNKDRKNLLKASAYARENNIGVNSNICTQTENPKNAKCNIKGNTTGKEKLYQLPSCKHYKNTLVQLHLGDRWFCTEKEALAAGFIKSGDCP